MATQLVSGREALRQLLRDTVWQSDPIAPKRFLTDRMKNTASRCVTSRRGGGSLVPALCGYFTQSVGTPPSTKLTSLMGCAQGSQFCRLRCIDLFLWSAMFKGDC